MRARTVLAAALVTVTAAGAASPALAAKPKPKPIKGSFTATANPDPTSNNPGVDTGTCNPTTPTARVTKAFTVPAAGTLEVKANNMLDWTLDLRDAGGVIADSDGTDPDSAESMVVKFKKKTVVTIGACNFAGEPTITPTYVFTYK